MTRLTQAELARLRGVDHPTPSWAMRTPRHGLACSFTNARRARFEDSVMGWMSFAYHDAFRPQTGWRRFPALMCREMREHIALDRMEQRS